MTPHASKDLVRRYLHHSNARQTGAMDGLRTATFLAHVPRQGALDDAVPMTAAELNADLVMISSAFPDLTNTPMALLAEDDLVSARCRLTGTFEGPLGALQGTGETIAWDTVHLYRVAEDLLAEAWFVTDTLGLLQQAGAIKMLMGPDAGPRDATTS